MEAQLHLLPTETLDRHDSSWRLDEPTRAVGRKGVAEARSALRAAMRHRSTDQAAHTDPHASAA